MNYSYSTEGSKCPYCDLQITADDNHFFDEMNYTKDTCDDSGGEFSVSVYTEMTWTCTQVQHE